MRIGAVFPQTEIGADPADIRAWASAVEEIGYRHVLAYDHVLGAGTDTRPGWRGCTSETAFHEVFVLFGYLAAITTVSLREVPRDQWLSVADGWRALGATHLCVNTMGLGLADAAAHLATLREVWQAIG